MSTTPNQKDLLAKKTDLEGILKPDANDILHLPDITITLAENGQFYLAGISKKLLTLIGNTSGNAVTLDGDAGLTFTTSGGSSTITGITSSSGNSASLAASQSMVSAKQDKIVAGTNITIAQDGKTISATDTNELENLTDVNITTPTDGQGLVYNDTTQKWENGNVSSASSIDTLTDVNLTNLTNGQILKYNSTSQEWENANESGGGGGSTVTITPTLSTGTKIADYSIDGTTGALYAPSGGGGGSGDSFITYTKTVTTTNYGWWTVEDKDGNVLDPDEYIIVDISVTPYYYDVLWSTDSDGGNHYSATLININDVYEIRSSTTYDWTITYAKKDFSGGGGAGAEEISLPDYNALTTAQKNDGTIRFIPESSVGTTNPIDMLNPTNISESSNIVITPSEKSVEMTWDTSTSTGIAATFYYSQIDVTNYDYLAYDLVTGDSYDSLHSGSENSIRDLGIGLRSSAPSTWAYAPNIDWTIWNRYRVTDTNRNLGTQSLDVSGLSGVYYLIIAGVGWEATISNLKYATSGGNESQIKYMDKTYAKDSTGADEITLSEYNALTTEQKNDGMIRFIPESNIGSSTAINMSYITKFKEADMDDIATSSSETTITWDGGVYIGNTYYYTTPIDVTDYDNIIFDLTTGSCYGGGSSAQQTRWNIQVGLMSVAPTTALVIDATDSSWAVCKDFANSNTVYSDQELDVSELTGSYYLVINAHGWNATLENFILAIVGGNPSQIKYMDKTYANNSGGGTTVVANPQDPATDTLSTIEIDGTIYNIEGSGGGGSVTAIEEIYKNTAGTIPDTINLTKPINDFDIILITGFRSNTPTWKMSTFYVSSTINSGDVIELNDDAYYAWYTVTDLSTLTKNAVQYDVIDTIYGLKFGSGGSSSGGLTSTTLLSTPITVTGTYTLADSYTNYDFIGFRAGNGSNETDILLYPVKEITDAMNDSLIITNPVTNSWFNFTMSGSSLVITGKTVDTIYSVIGYKIGGGSGGGSGGFITYSTTATLTQYGWWTVEDKDGNTLNPDDYIIIDISVSTDNSSSWNGAYDVLWYHETGDNYYAATFVDINDGRFPRSSGSFPVTVTYAPKGGGGASLPNNYTVTADSLKINNEVPSTGVAWTIEDDTDYFDSAASITINTRVYQKTNAVPALGGVYMIYASGNKWTTVMFTSTDATAVAYSGNADPFGSFSYLGHTWYFSGTDYAMSGDNSSAVSGARYIGDFSQYDYSTKECCIEAAKYLIDHAGVSFEENNFTTISRPSTGYIIAGGGSAPDFSDATFKVTKQGDIYSKGNLLEDIFQKKSQELTSSQYENLTLAEKTNGTIYFINDPVPENQLISRVSAADSRITSSGHSRWGGEDWHAFDGITGSLSGIDNAWCALEDDATPWIQYHFDTPYYFTKLEMKVYCHYGSDGKTVSMNILASNDGTNWDNISMSGTAVSVIFPYQTLSTVEFDLNNGGNKYEYIRIQGTEPFEVAYSYGCDFDEIYVYGTDQGSPVKKIYYMNSLYAKSNDSSIERKYLGQLINRVATDDSHIIKSSENSTYPAWGAFSGVSPTHFGGGTDPESNTCWLSTVNEATPYLGYHFDTPYYFTKIDIKCFSNYSTDWVHNIQVLGSKDGNNYENILAEGSTYELTAPYLTNTTTSINLNETDTYSYIKVVFSSPVSIAYQPSCFVDEIYVYGGEIVENKKDLHTYSTTEQKVGTWIDGSDIYEKSFEVTITQSSNPIIEQDASYIDALISYDAVVKNTLGYMSGVGMNARGWDFALHRNPLEQLLIFGDVSEAIGGKAYVTIRYTKVSTS